MADIIIVPAAQITQILAVGVVPVDGRVVAGIGQGLIQRPEAASEALGVLGNRLGEVVALRADCTDDRDGTFCAVQRLDITGALVELRQAAGQVRRIALIGGHFLQTAADLTQSLGPAGGGVSHHGGVVAHVAVILGQRNAGVDGRLTRSNRHVGRVGNQHGTIHQALASAGVDQFAELLQGLGHLVAALAAADIDDDIGVTPLCDLVLGHRFAGAEAAGDGRRTALGQREHRINDALAGNQRPGRGHALGRRTRGADGPLLTQGQRVFLALGVGQLYNG